MVNDVALIVGLAGLSVQAGAGQVCHVVVGRNVQDVMACATVNLFIATAPSLLTPQFVISITESASLGRCCTFCIQGRQRYSCDIQKRCAESCKPFDNFTPASPLPSPTLSLPQQGEPRSLPEDGSAAPLHSAPLSVNPRCRPCWAPATNFMHMAIQPHKIHALAGARDRSAERPH